ncbi:hypothetical protein MUL_5113 [Mycobacterium ulcerans Agy99]|uniref:Uncharacterized protein n=1 Tax=Mycobacterium ulcerans (strain Agy99) TaxID=362242 RepID=A0PNW7_MYCUA|nr:hypothetical protein MUL_5113 [Mycobacterium ulcerans Agy99]
MSPGGFRFTGHVVWCQSFDEWGADSPTFVGHLYSFAHGNRAVIRTRRGCEEVRDV